MSGASRSDEGCARRVPGGCPALPLKSGATRKSLNAIRRGLPRPELDVGPTRDSKHRQLARDPLRICSPRTGRAWLVSPAARSRCPPRRSVPGARCGQRAPGPARPRARSLPTAGPRRLGRSRPGFHNPKGCVKTVRARRGAGAPLGQRRTPGTGAGCRCPQRAPGAERRGGEQRSRGYTFLRVAVVFSRHV